MVLLIYATYFKIYFLNMKYLKLFEDFLNESWNTEKLLHKLHFAETEKDYEIAKNALKNQWDDDDIEYSFKKFII